MRATYPPQHIPPTKSNCTTQQTRATSETNRSPCSTTRTDRSHPSRIRTHPRPMTTLRHLFPSRAHGGRATRLPQHFPLLHHHQSTLYRPRRRPCLPSLILRLPRVYSRSAASVARLLATSAQIRAAGSTGSPPSRKRSSPLSSGILPPSAWVSLLRFLQYPRLPAAAIRRLPPNHRRHPACPIPISSPRVHGDLRMCRRLQVSSTGTPPKAQSFSGEQNLQHHPVHARHLQQSRPRLPARIRSRSRLPTRRCPGAPTRRVSSWSPAGLDLCRSLVVGPQ